jgi:hypothetical protein
MLPIPSGRVAIASFAVTMAVTMAVALPSGALGAQHPARSGTTSFVLAGNRVYALLDFVNPDGSLHRAYAYVDPGRTEMSLGAALYDTLRAGAGATVRFRVGDFAVDVAGGRLQRGGSVTPHGTGPQVEAALPAWVLQPYMVALDYAKKTFSIGESGSIPADGQSTRVRIDTITGLIAVDARVDGKTYPVTIDIGSAYTWLRRDTVETWLGAHPEWERGSGAVGTANMMLRGEEPERDGVLVRVPRMSIGPVQLDDVGVLGVNGGRGGGGGGADTSLTLMDWYSRKNAVPVLGWFGGNVLKQFRLTIDYPARTMYWLREMSPDTTELDQIGLTLGVAKGAVLVAGLARKHGQPVIDGVRPGDELVSVDGHVLATGTLAEVFESMHGVPGEKRELVLRRDGKEFTVSAPITRF